MRRNRSSTVQTVTGGLPIGSIAGVRVNVHWSFAIVFALVAWTLAVAVFPEQDPRQGHRAYVAMGLVAAALIVLSLLAHELAHAVEARRAGMWTEDVTLWLFGGVARFRGAFPSAAAELRVALAGPAVSVALGVVAAALAWLVPLPAVADGVVAWFGYITLGLGLFNLLPALPLDGGRVLRAALWHTTGDRSQATALVSSVGWLLGLALAVAGAVAFVLRSPYGGVWLLVSGLFLLRSR
jgi:Zn-dependent protease